MADLDAMLDEAANATFKAEAPKKKVDPPEIKPWLASTALVTPELRDKWSALVRFDNDAVIRTKFLPSIAYQSGDGGAASNTNSNRILYEQVKLASAKCGFDDAKTSRITSILNPMTDDEDGKAIQVAYRKFLLKKLKEDILDDVNYDPSKFPNLAAYLSHQ